MEQEKNKNGVNLLLILIIIILAILCILFATETININNGGINNNQNSKNNVQTIDNNRTVDNNISNDILDKILPVIGVNDRTSNSSNCVSHMLMTRRAGRFDNYTVDDAFWLVMSYYSQYYGHSNGVADDKCLDPGKPVPGGRCLSFSKETINEIIKNYDFKYTADEIFANNLRKQDSENYYVFLDLAGMCAGIKSEKHTISSWYGTESQMKDNLSTGDYITIRDEITIKYSNNGNDSSSRVIYYTFKVENDTYKLWLYYIY